MSGNIVVNIDQNNLVPNTKNVFRYSFNQTVVLNNKEIALGKLQLYYSWFNITAKFRNNSFSYVWVDGTQVTVNLPDGFYSVEALNGFLQDMMKQQGHYIIDNTGTLNFYLAFRTNATYYAIQISSTPVPSSISGDWVKGGAWALPGVATNPQLFVRNDNQFSEVIGFAPGYYPSVVVPGAQRDTLSTFTPQLHPVSTVNMYCNIVQNRVSSKPHWLYSFMTTNSTFGSSMEVAPPSFIFSPVSDNAQTYIEITFTDQNEVPLEILDPQVSLVLIIKNRE